LIRNSPRSFSDEFGGLEMIENKVKRLWAEGKPVLHGWLSVGNAFTAEIMAAQGYDAISVDWQHGALDYSDLLPMFQAMRASGTTIGARVPWLDPAAIIKALDAGAMQIICPMINSLSASRTAQFWSYTGSICARGEHPCRGQ